MGLPKKFDDRLRRNLGVRAVWLPGSEIMPGAVLQRRDDAFLPIASLSDFGVSFASHSMLGQVSLTFQARGVSSTVVQAGADVDLSRIDTKANAEIEIRFEREATYLIRTPTLSGKEIRNLLAIGNALKDASGWNHSRYFVVAGVYRAGEFLFLGSQTGNQTVRFGGRGDAVRDFLTVGASANVTRTSSSSVSIEIVGQGGPVAMRVVRFKRDGRVY